MHGVRSDAPYLEEEWKTALNAGRYQTEIAIMREMSWSWRDLMESPFDLVQELIVRIGAERHWQEEKRKQSTK